MANIRAASTRFLKILTSLRVGFFLAVRQLGRTNKGTTALIIFVMALTFLNLVFIGGILVGLIEGSTTTYRQLYSGDVIMSVLDKKPYIEDSPAAIAVAESLPWTRAVSARYVAGGLLEANYKDRTNYTDPPDQTNVLVEGMNPEDENSVTGIKNHLVEGSYLEPGDIDSVLVGSTKLYQYSPIDTPGLKTLKNVTVGTKVRIDIDGNVREFTVKGIVKSKVQEMDSRVYMLDTSVRDMLGRTDNGVNEIVMRLDSQSDADLAKQALMVSGIGDRAKIQTWQDAQPKAIKDIEGTFAMLGNIVGSIGLVVAAITTFIVIYINAITRRKFIGILRGIGVDAIAIEFSYVLQALVYSVMGTAFGILILVYILEPYFAAHPIDFPFSDGILVATFSGTLIRAALLVLASVVAGYIPARIVNNQNVLDAILGR